MRHRWHVIAPDLRGHGDSGWSHDGAYLTAWHALDSTAFWRAISAPVLLMHGTESWTTNAEEDGRAAHFRDRQTVVFENAGHWIHHDRFDAFIAALRDFL